MPAERPTGSHRPNFSVALIGDFAEPDGKLKFPDIGLSVLEGYPQVKRAASAAGGSEILPEDVRGTQGVIVMTQKVTARSVSQASELLVVARFGVGYDAEPRGVLNPDLFERPSFVEKWHR